MSVGLTDRGRHLGLGSSAWCRVLLLAYDYGWRPEGTYATDWNDGADEVEEPSPSELAGAAQLIPGSDETRAAFEGAVSSFSEQAPEIEMQWRGYDYSSNDGQLVSETDAANLAEALARALAPHGDHEAIPAGARSGRAAAPDRAGTEEHHVLREVIAFCRAGGFAIW